MHFSFSNTFMQSFPRSFSSLGLLVYYISNVTNHRCDFPISSCYFVHCTLGCGVHYYLIMLCRRHWTTFTLMRCSRYADQSTVDRCTVSTLGARSAEESRLSRAARTVVTLSIRRPRPSAGCSADRLTLLSTYTFTRIPSLNEPVFCPPGVVRVIICYPNYHKCESDNIVLYSREQQQ